MKIAKLKVRQAKRRLHMYVAALWLLASIAALSFIGMVSGAVLGLTNVLAGDPAAALFMFGILGVPLPALGASWFFEQRDGLELRVAVAEEEFDRVIQRETDRILRAA